MGKKIVVTGGAGFIGSVLVEKLVKNNSEVTVFDNFSLGKMQNLSAVKDKINVVTGDIMNAVELEKVVEGTDFVFHMAALSYAEESIKFQQKYNSINIDGTFNVLSACRAKGVKRVIFPSTCLVYGPTATNDFLNESLALNTTNPYGLTKATGEGFCRLFNEIYGLETICFRIFNAYGPRMQNRVISKFANLMLENKPPVINGSGEQKRDFVYVTDIADGLICGMKAKKKQCGKSYNIGTGKGYTLKELVKMLSLSLGKNFLITHAESVHGETDKIVADTKMAKKELRFEAKVGFKKGLKLTVEWLEKEFMSKKTGMP